MDAKPWRFLCVLMAVSLRGVADALPGGGAVDAPPHCVIMDQALARPQYAYGFHYTTGADIEGHGDTALFGLSGHWDFAYFRNVLAGDLSVGAFGRFDVFTGSGGVGLPDQIGAFGLDLGWNHRRWDGSAWVVRVAPGLYADMEEFDFGAMFFPFGVAWVQSLSPTFSAIAGLDVRPGYELPVMPRLGVAWSPAEALRVEAMLPESRIVFSPLRDWTLDAGIAWENQDYKLREDGRDRLTVEAWRFQVGLAYRLDDQWQVRGAVGMLRGRSFEFGGTAPGVPDAVDIDDAVFVSLQAASPF